MKVPPRRRGWGIPHTRSLAKYHYFRDGRSLCQRHIDYGAIHLLLWGTYELVKELEGQGKKLTEEACQKCRKIP